MLWLTLSVGYGLGVWLAACGPMLPGVLGGWVFFGGVLQGVVLVSAFRTIWEGR